MSITLYMYSFFLVIRTFKVCSLGNFQICNRMLLTIGAMLCVTPPGLTYVITRSLYLLPTFIHSPYPRPCLWQPPVCPLYL